MIYGHNRNIDINFYNDRVKEFIAEEGFTNPFSYVPIKAAHMEVVSGKSGSAVVFGNITEGYDPVELRVEVEKNYTDIATEAANIPLLVDKYISGIYYYDWDHPLNTSGGLNLQIRVVRVYLIQIPYYVREDAFYFINVEGVGSVSYQVGAGETGLDVKTALEAALTASPVFGPSSFVAGPNPLTIYFYNLSKIYWGGTLANEWPVITDEMIFPYNVTAHCLDLGLTTKFPILKYGATHDFGIVYKDKIGRRCSVLRTKNMSFYLPFYCEDPAILMNTIASVTFKLNHLPPVWAEAYEIVYAGNASMDYWLQIRINDINDLGDDRFAINIQDNLNWTRENNMRWKVPDYVWEDGDRIRLIGTITNAEGVVTVYTTDEGHVYDYEIEETAASELAEEIGGDWLIVQAAIRPASFDGETDIIAEIYRPKKGIGVSVYQGTGMAFEIGVDENGNRYHKGDVDQVLSSAGGSLTPAEIYNTANDSWKYERISYVSEAVDPAGSFWAFWAESPFPSDWWRDITKLTSQGWPFLYDIMQQQVTLGERLRHGGFLIEGTRINNIAWFTYEKFMDLPQRYGDITALREIGFTLKVLQTHKESSIYLQRVQTFSADGGEGDYSLINNLLGTFRPLETDFGCQHPDSVMVNDRNLYYWDNNEGKFIRSSPNGQIAISDYKMRRWFRDLRNWIEALEGTDKLLVNTGANVEHNEVWVTWNINGTVWGAIFSETNGRWISRLDQITESYVHLGQWFAHMYKQRLYIMNEDEGQNWLEWANVPTYADVQFAGNINVAKNKVFNSLAVYADHQLDCLSRFIIIPAEASFELMESYVAIWNKSEGIYYGRILKDQNSPGSFVSVHDQTMNGREMRGRYCLVRLRTNEHEEKVRIFSVIVISTDSERSA